MDTLQISGKWYISTGRAAKEHGYHADYIGQLIRSGQIKGQKVGRSWYVLADSLTDYFENNKSTKKVLKSKKDNNRTVTVHAKEDATHISAPIKEDRAADLSKVESAKERVPVMQSASIVSTLKPLIKTEKIPATETKLMTYIQDSNEQNDEKSIVPIEKSSDDEPATPIHIKTLSGFSSRFADPKQIDPLPIVPRVTGGMIRTMPASPATQAVSAVSQGVGVTVSRPAEVNIKSSLRTTHRPLWHYIFMFFAGAVLFIVASNINI